MNISIGIPCHIDFSVSSGLCLQEWSKDEWNLGQCHDSAKGGGHGGHGDAWDGGPFVFRQAMAGPRKWGKHRKSMMLSMVFSISMEKCVVWDVFGHVLKRTRSSNMRCFGCRVSFASTKCIHICMHNCTAYYITLYYITLRYITLHYIHYINIHSDCVIFLDTRLTTLHSLHFIAPITLHHIAWENNRYHMRTPTHRCMDT